MGDDINSEVSISQIMTAINTIDGFFLKVSVDGLPAGLYWLIRSGDGVEAHTALLENCRGRNAVSATKMAIKWVFENEGSKFIKSYAFSDSPQVKWLCRLVGMREIGDSPYPNKRMGLPVSLKNYIIENPNSC